jgi:hypothetical protein
MSNDPHAIAKECFDLVRKAKKTKDLEAALTKATNYWVVDALDVGTVEAVAYRSRDKARELWRAAGCPEIAIDQSRKEPTTQPLVEPEAYEDFQKQREEFKKNKLRYNAGMGRKGIIR